MESLSSLLILANCFDLTLFTHLLAPVFNCYAYKRSLCSLLISIVSQPNSINILACLDTIFSFLLAKNHYKQVHMHYDS